MSEKTVKTTEISSTAIAAYPGFSVLSSQHTKGHGVVLRSEPVVAWKIIELEFEWDGAIERMTTVDPVCCSGIPSHGFPYVLRYPDGRVTHLGDQFAEFFPTKDGDDDERASDDQLVEFFERAWQQVRDAVHRDRVASELPQ